MWQAQPTVAAPPANNIAASFPAETCEATEIQIAAEEVGIVKRPMKVTVKALDRNGNPFTVTGEGLLARAFCHELDHLDGVLYIDRASRMLTPEELEDDED